MPASTPSSETRSRRFRARWLLLVLPYIGMCFPQFYARNTPAVFGFPFFYWYQFAWVPITSLVIWLAYRRAARDETN